MSGSVADLLCCWHHWLGKYNSDIWNLVLGCLMWTVWIERNRCSFEDIKKSMVQLLDLCQRTLFDWSWCWGLLDCSTIIDFLLSLRIGFWFLYFFLLLCCSLFTTVNSVYLLFFSINNITFLPIKKKEILYMSFTSQRMCLWMPFSAFFVVLYVKVLFKMRFSSYRFSFSACWQDRSRWFKGLVSCSFSFQLHVLKFHLLIRSNKKWLIN